MNIDLEQIRKEFLSFAPSYVQGPASEAISNLIDLSHKKIITDGLYYIVVVDLVGSTRFGVDNGNEALSNRIEIFIASSIKALNCFELKSKALFVKEIGDAVLFLFHHFPDILEWNYHFRKYLESNIIKESPIMIRTIIHTGEVYLKGVNPIALSVSQTFKLEKDVPDNSIGLTESAYLSAYPTISRAYHAFSKLKDVEMPGYDKTIPLYLLNFKTDEDIEYITKEDHEYS